MDTFDNSLDNLEILPEYTKRFKTVKTKRDSLPSLAIYSNPIHATFGRERFRSEDLIFIPESSPCKQPFLCNDDNITFTMPRRIDIESDDDQDQDLSFYSKSQYQDTLLYKLDVLDNDLKKDELPLSKDKDKSNSTHISINKSPRSSKSATKISIQQTPPSPSKKEHEKEDNLKNNEILSSDKNSDPVIIEHADMMFDFKTMFKNDCSIQIIFKDKIGRLKSKVSKVAMFWKKQSQLIPNVFRQLKGIPGNSQALVELQDMSRKEVLIPIVKKKTIEKKKRRKGKSRRRRKR